MYARKINSAARYIFAVKSMQTDYTGNLYIYCLFVQLLICMRVYYRQQMTLPFQQCFSVSCDDDETLLDLLLWKPLNNVARPCYFHVTFTATYR